MRLANDDAGTRYHFINPTGGEVVLWTRLNEDPWDRLADLLKQIPHRWALRGWRLANTSGKDDPSAPAGGLLASSSAQSAVSPGVPDVSNP